MAFCIKCGAKLNDGSNFCVKCGTPQNKGALEVKEKVAESVSVVPLYHGEEKSFISLGRQLRISPELDVFNFYRKTYRELAKDAVGKLRSNYNNQIRCLDDFLVKFNDMYIAWRETLLENAVFVLAKAGAYDVTLESLTLMHIGLILISMAFRFGTG